MLIAAVEGQGFRYEIVERAEGFAVRPRDLDTGLADEDGRVFRTAAVAFAYANLSASLDRYAAASLAPEQEDGTELRAEYENLEARYRDLSGRLLDTGTDERVMLAWSDPQERGSAHLH